MQKIKLSNNIVNYYGNLAGYIEKDTAVIDPMFERDDLIGFLREKNLGIRITSGVYDKLAAGAKMQKSGNLSEIVRLKDCRIHQLKAEVDPAMKFISYDELIKNGFSEPDRDNYNIIYDGEIETNDLEEIYQKFNLNHPPDYKGHSLSISDVIELYDSGGSSFHYVDCFGFKEISFTGDEQAENQQQGMMQSF